MSQTHAQPSFYWFDFETFGLSPAHDRPSQFAGVRTDTELNIIGEPLTLYCQPAADHVPDLQACLITGISPLQTQEKGQTEATFFHTILHELTQPYTCGVGFNSLKFDDEVIRFGLFRNLKDPYRREYANGNSRWDLLPALRMAAALRPQGINWPWDDVQQRPSFRLEQLTMANGIEHGQAHDALADVVATIEMAKLLKQTQPKLWRFLLSLRRKDQVLAVLKPAQQPIFVHSSSKLGGDKRYTSLMMVLQPHPSNRNAYLCVDLAQTPPLDLATLAQDKEALSERLFTAKSDPIRTHERLPIKEIRINQAPTVAPLSVLTLLSDNQKEQMPWLDVGQAQAHRQVWLQHLPSLSAQLDAVFMPPVTPDWLDMVDNTDRSWLDGTLYQGGFLSTNDRAQLQRIEHMSWPELKETSFCFEDSRLALQVWLYRARNAPWSLTDSELQTWTQHCRAVWQQTDGDSSTAWQKALEAVAVARQQQLPLSSRQQQVLDEFEQYIQQQTRALNLS